jgi:KDO2-lipid IV(A) lauroyltransferase
VAQYVLIPKRLARRFPLLGRCALWLEAGLFRLIFWLVGRLSIEQSSRLGSFLFGLIGPFSSKKSKAIINLRVAFPDQPEQWYRQTAGGIFRHLGMAVAELIKFGDIWEQREQRIVFHTDPDTQALIDQGTPIVFVTAHVGAWQLTNMIAMEKGLDIGTVYAPESNQALSDKMLELRGAFGVKLIPSSAGLRPLLRQLNNGACIGLAMDTRLNTGTLLPYFGRDALTNTSAARLAQRTGAAVVPVRGQRVGHGRYRITAFAPISPAPNSGDAEAQALSISTRINACFEEWIREEPEQWICLKRRWPKAHRL